MNGLSQFDTKSDKTSAVLLKSSAGRTIPAGQDNRKTAAAAGGGADFDAAVVLLYDLVGDEKAQAGAFSAFGREENREKF